MTGKILEDSGFWQLHDLKHMAEFHLVRRFEYEVCVEYISTSELNSVFRKGDYIWNFGIIGSTKPVSFILELLVNNKHSRKQINHSTSRTPFLIIICCMLGKIRIL